MGLLRAVAMVAISALPVASGFNDLLGDVLRASAPVAAAAPPQPESLPVQVPAQAAGGGVQLEGALDHIVGELSSFRGQVVQREQAQASENAQLQKEDERLRAAVTEAQQRLQKADSENSRLQQQQAQTAAQLASLQSASRKLVGRYRELEAKDATFEQQTQALKGQNVNLQQENQRLLATVQRIRRAQAMMSSELDGVGTDPGTAAAPLGGGTPAAPSAPAPSGAADALQAVLAGAGAAAAVPAAPPVEAAARPAAPRLEAASPEHPQPASPPMVRAIAAPGRPQHPGAESVAPRLAPARPAQAPIGGLSHSPAVPATPVVGLSRPVLAPAANADRSKPVQDSAHDLSADLASLSADAGPEATVNGNVDDMLISKADDQVLKMARDAGFLPPS